MPWLSMAARIMAFCSLWILAILLNTVFSSGSLPSELPRHTTYYAPFNPYFRCHPFQAQCRHPGSLAASSNNKDGVSIRLSEISWRLNTWNGWIVQPHQRWYERIRHWWAHRFQRQGELQLIWNVSMVARYEGVTFIFLDCRQPKKKHAPCTICSCFAFWGIESADRIYPKEVVVIQEIHCDTMLSYLPIDHHMKMGQPCK